MAEKTLAFWIALVQRLGYERYTTALDEHGVTLTQWQLLGALAGGASTPSELEAALKDAPVDRGANPVAELAELVESGWVTADGSYAITDRGVQAYDRLAEVVDDLRHTLTEGVTEADQATASVALERMALNLGWSTE